MYFVSLTFHIFVPCLLQNITWDGALISSPGVGHHLRVFVISRSRSTTPCIKQALKNCDIRRADWLSESWNDTQMKISAARVVAEEKNYRVVYLGEKMISTIGTGWWTLTSYCCVPGNKYLQTVLWRPRFSTCSWQRHEQEGPWNQTV